MDPRALKLPPVEMSWETAELVRKVEPSRLNREIVDPAQRVPTWRMLRVDWKSS